METGPIFIGGLSYSGKTYLRLMLLAHPDLMLTRRTKMWTRFYGRFGDLAHRENFERCLQAMLEAKHIRELQPEPSRIRHEFDRGAPTYARLFALFHAHHAEGLGKRRWGDQLGGVEAYADQILSAYPEAKMIHMVRDPLERGAASIAKSQHRRAKLGWEMAEWRRSARLARRNVRRYPNRYLIVHYEALLGCREETLRQVCDFLEETFLPAMLAVDGVPEAGNGQPVRTGLVPSSESISNRQIALFRAGAGREMASLDYVPRPLRLSLGDWLLLASVDLPLNLAGQAIWWLRERKRKN